MEAIGIGIVGSGFVADAHARMYRELGGVEVRLVGVASRTPAGAEAFARRHGIENALPDYAALLRRPDIQIVDLCVPNHLHEPYAIQAARAGKHIICEKPLTGYFGGPGASDPVGATPKRLMLAAVLESADRMLAAAHEHQVRLMYAENWLYSPPIQKARRLVEASRGTILEVRAQECHSGSHAGYAKTWRLAGGGALLRLGSHPVGAALYLKQQEGLRRGGAPIRVRSVVAEVGDVTRIESFRGEAEHWLVTGWEDVENWATVTMTFSDGSHATIFAADTALGGMEDSLEVFLSNGRVKCDLGHNTTVQAYAPAAHIFADEYLSEKLETKAGWSYPSAHEAWLLGYPQELRDFAEAVAEGRPPLSTPELGRDVVEVIYAAYTSAEEGCRVTLDGA